MYNDPLVAGKRALADLVARSIAAERQQAKRDLASIPGQIGELSRRLVGLDRRLVAAAQRLEQLTDRSDVEAFAASELDRLLAIDGVRAVHVEASELHVESEPIVIASADRRYDLGAYCLTIDLAGDVRIESQDHRGPKPLWDHPHVQGGLPCLGNLREGILKLIAEYELALAVQVLIDFLRTYNPETAYTPIEGWPEADA
jgi:hypothetical protein